MNIRIHPLVRVVLGLTGSSILAIGCSSPSDPPVDVDAAVVDVDAAVEPPDDVKPLKYTDSADGSFAAANWRIALDPDAVEGAPAITAPSPQHSAHLFDLTETDIELAGFLSTRPAGSNTALTESQVAIAAILSVPSISGVTPRVTGTPTLSADGFDTVLTTIVEVEVSAPADVTGVRDAIVPALLGKQPADVSLPDMNWAGQADTSFLIAFQTLHRAADNQTLYMGAVTRRAAFDDRARATALYASDLANGTSLSVSGEPEQIDEQLLPGNQTPKADIIWVVDESGSMFDERTRVSDAAAEFFQKAVMANLDFRMGVTDMNEAGPGGQPGIFATRQAGGTGDRWLSPTEAAEFAAAITDPSGPDPAVLGFEHGLVQGRSAIDRHLPRDNNDPQKIRENVQLVVLYISDEMPQSVRDNTSMDGTNSQPTPMQQGEINAEVAPLIAHLNTNNATAHLIGETLPFENPPTCGAVHAYGYYDVVNVTGGQVGSICQSNLGPTIDAIISSITGQGSPLTLTTNPISASISVTINDEPVPRSRMNGWDYDAASNSIVFFNTPIDPANPSELVVAYRRWAD